MRGKKKIRRPQAKTGAPPGTLIHVGERKADTTQIRLIDYDEKRVEEHDLKEVAHALEYRDRTSVTWLNIDGVHDIRIIEEIGRCFDVHSLVQEDILNTEHRPKLEEHDDFLFMVLKMLRTDPGGEIHAEQISLVLGRGFVLSFREAQGDAFDPVRERIRNDRGRIRRMGPDYLAYALLDSIVDNYYVVLEEIGDRIEALEEELLTRPTPVTAQKIHRFKREMILIRKSIWPLREVVGSLHRQQEPLVREGTRLYLRDLYDHTIQVIDTVESYRDIIAGLLDLYLSSLSTRMNEVMKVLTIIATIFIPLTFIAGVYGMNFHYMPELEWRWAYPVIWGVMIALALGMLAVFRKKRWF
jgi:magnesium transporter